MNIILYALMFVFYRTLNAHRDKIWNAWTPEVCKEFDFFYMLTS